MEHEQPVDVVDVGVEVRNEQQRCVAERVREPLEIELIPARKHVVVVEVLGDTIGQLGGHHASERVGDVARLGVTEQVVMDAVDDDPAERQTALGERLAEPDGLVDRLALGRGHEHERGRVRAQQLLDLPGAQAEVVGHVAEQSEERREVAEEIDPRHPPERGEQRARALAEDAHPEAGRADERLQRAALQERGQPPGGVEEVERVAGGRGVEHEQVERVCLRRGRTAWRPR